MNFLKIMAGLWGVYFSKIKVLVVLFMIGGWLFGFCGVLFKITIGELFWSWDFLWSWWDFSRIEAAFKDYYFLIAFSKINLNFWAPIFYFLSRWWLFQIFRSDPLSKIKRVAHFLPRLGLFLAPLKFIAEITFLSFSPFLYYQNQDQGDFLKIKVHFQKP